MYFQPQKLQTAVIQWALGLRAIPGNTVSFCSKRGTDKICTNSCIMSLAPLVKKEENGAEKQFLQEMENHPSGDTLQGSLLLSSCNAWRLHFIFNE